VNSVSLAGTLGVVIERGGFGDTISCLKMTLSVTSGRADGWSLCGALVRTRGSVEVDGGEDTSPRSSSMTLK
jgi:hypothetical protein